MKELGCTSCVELETCPIIRNDLSNYLSINNNQSIDDIVMQASPIQSIKDDMFTVNTRSAFSDEPGYLVVKDPSDTIYEKALEDEINNVLKLLTKRESMVLQLRFGLIDGKNRTLEEVAKEFGVTRERIRQIEAKALRKLKHPTKSRHLRQFYSYTVSADDNQDTNTKQKDKTISKSDSLNNAEQTILPDNGTSMKQHIIDNPDDEKSVFGLFFSVDEESMEDQITEEQAVIIEKSDDSLSGINRQDYIQKIRQLLLRYPDGLKARTISKMLKIEKKEVNSILYSNKEHFIVNNDFIWKIKL